MCVCACVRARALCVYGECGGFGVGVHALVCACALVALLMQQTTRHVPYCVLSGSNHTFRHYLIKGTIFENKKLLNTKCVF